MSQNQSFISDFSEYYKVCTDMWGYIQYIYNDMVDTKTQNAYFQTIHYKFPLNEWFNTI